MTPAPVPAPPEPARTRRPVLLVLAAMFAFSLMALFSRESGAPVAGVAAWRAVFVAVVFAVAAVLREGGRAALIRPSRDTVVLGSWLGLALAVASSTFVGGYAFTTVANTIFLHNLAPVVVFPLAWWLYGERPRPSALTGAGIALVGVALLSGVSFFQVAHFANPRFLLGDGLALLSAVGYGAVLVLTRATRRAGTPILATLAIAWSLAAVLLTVLALATGTFGLSASALAWTLGLAVICTNLPFYLLNLGMREVPAGTASVLSLSEVVFATLLGLVVYGESLAPVGWMGGLLATLGVLYAVSQLDGSDSEGTVSTGLSAAARPIRGARLGLALLLLNGGAALTLLGHGGGAAVLAWAGLAWIARLGPGLAAGGGAPSGALSWAGAAVGAVAVAGALLRGAGEFSEGSLLVAILALGAALADAGLAAAEPDEDRDPARLVSGGLAVLAVATAFGVLDHPAGVLLARVAAVTVALGALAAVLAGVRGQLAQPRPPLLPRLEGPLLRQLRPGRLAAALVLVWLGGGLHVVPAGHQGIVERFGAPLAEVTTPGLALRLPAPIESVRMVDVERLRRLPVIDAGTALLCGDQSMISLEGVLHFRVSDAQDFAFTAVEVEPTLRALARSSLTEAVSRRTHDAVLTSGRGELEVAARTRIQKRADALALGVEVVDLHLSSAAVPAPVLQAFLDVISADEARLTAINHAEAHAARVLPEAGGTAVSLLAQAHADASQIAVVAHRRSVLHEALVTSGGGSPTSRARLRIEAREARLAPRPVLVLPPSVTVWTGGSSPPPAPSPPRAEARP